MSKSTVKQYYKYLTKKSIIFILDQIADGSFKKSWKKSKLVELLKTYDETLVIENTPIEAYSKLIEHMTAEDQKVISQVHPDIFTLDSSDIDNLFEVINNTDISDIEETINNMDISDIEFLEELFKDAGFDD